MQVYVLQDEDKALMGVFEHRAAAFEYARHLFNSLEWYDDFDEMMDNWLVTCVEVL